MREYCFPKSISGAEFAAIRRSLDLTQAELADFLCVSKRTVEHWEISDSVKGTMLPLIYMLRENYGLKEQCTLPEKKGNIRLLFKQGSFILTVIDADMIKQQVWIKNFTKDPIKRAFGVNTEPGWEDFNNFLESRCFPRTRDKMKLILAELNIPFYDPIMIIEKTGGRMADDDFSVEVIRR